MEKTKLIFRIVVFPLIMCLTFLYSMYQLIEFWINFIIYGGEIVALTKKRNKESIASLFDKVQELVNKNNPTMQKFDNHPQL